MRAHAKPLFLRTASFSNPFSDFKKENAKPNVSALKSVFGFRVRLQIRNPDFPIERTLRVRMFVKSTVSYAITMKAMNIKM